MATQDWAAAVTDKTGDVLRVATVGHGEALSLETESAVLEFGPTEAENLKALIERYLAGCAR